MRNKPSKPNKLCYTILMWLAPVLWCAVLFFFSGQDGIDSGELSWRFTQFVLRVFPFLPIDAATLHPILRKCAHFGIFAVEGALLEWALLHTLPGHSLSGHTLRGHTLRGHILHGRTLSSRTLSVLLSALICTALAGLNEYHQNFIVGRSAEFTDVLIDAAGGLTGVLMALLIFVLIHKRGSDAGMGE